MSKDSVTRVLLVAALTVLCWSVLVFATGGVVWETAWFRFSSRDPFRPLVAAVLGLLAHSFLAPQAMTTFMDRVDRAVSRRGMVIAGALAAMIAILGLEYGTPHRERIRSAM